VFTFNDAFINRSSQLKRYSGGGNIEVQQLLKSDLVQIESNVLFLLRKAYGNYKKIKSNQCKSLTTIQRIFQISKRIPFGIDEGLKSRQEVHTGATQVA